MLNKKTFSSYDFLCFVETKLRDTDIISLPGFEFISQPRKQTVIRRSGGICILVNENISKNISLLETDSDYIMWVRVDKKLTNLDEDIILGVIYVPPTQSKYFSEEEILNLESEIISFCSNNRYVIITGDINARTAKLNDYVIADNFLSDYFDFDDETLSFFDKTNTLFHYGVPLNRANCDRKTNNNGHWLIDTCKNNNLFIVNGRIGKDKSVGAPTFRDSSTIDYTIVSADCFKIFCEFEVMELDPIFSDGHSLLSWSLKIPMNEQVCKKPSSQNNTTNSFKWSLNAKENYIDSIDIQKVSDINNTLDLLDPSTDTLNKISNEVANIFMTAASKSLPPRKPPFKRRSFDKPWFGPACKFARQRYHRAKKNYEYNKSAYAKNNLKLQSKQYKIVMNKYISRHRANKSKQLRDMQSKNPKEYWRYLNSINYNKRQKEQPSLNEFYEHFKNINTNNEADEQLTYEYLNDENLILNSHITKEEINVCIKNLKSGKSPGEDKILNEYIKSTKHIFLPLYEKLFNKVLDSGNLPDSWLEGTIKPIFKNKGNSTQPQNYRPITILSCVGKLFTSILNNRLTRFLNNDNIISENQAGFRKDYCTNDHIFVLSSLIEILKIKRQKLFCAFIDFSQAFDSVWRVGLWRKLLFNSIKGKFFQIIYKMYDNIKSCVKHNNQTSAYFPCQCGVRQGENLSPLLFAIYLNDLETFLLASGSEGINLEFNNEDILCYLKLLILLYADDTVIFSNDKDDFQNCLNAFNEYCEMWKLTINYSKTKIIVFNARNTNNINFKMGECDIIITDNYKYLGVLLYKSGSFLKAKKHIVEQAKKAMYLLFMRIHNLELPLDLQLKLFDNTVLPILTYSCEIWGYENNEIIERIHLDFLRKITHTRKSTPKYMLYAELGRYPIDLVIKQRTISYWTRLVTGKKSKLTYQLYLYMLNSNYQFKWPNFVQLILNNCGLNYLWLQQFYNLPKNVANLVKINLKDQYIQNWHSQLQNSSKGKNYNLFKNDIGLESYITILHGSSLFNMFRFRTSNHNLPVETGRWENIILADRKCQLCQKNDIGDEFHYLLICPYFNDERKKSINQYFFKRPNILKFSELLNMKNETKLIKLSSFMRHIMNVLKR
ncbi:MAG: reverse transcriptase family protein [Candidatus Thiodiazotropha sp.]